MVVLGSIPPKDFPIQKIVSIEKGLTLSGVADILSRESVIRSAFLYKVYVRLLGGSVRSGGYVLTRPQSSLTIALRTSTGDQGLPKIKVTIPEGSTSYDIAWILQKKLPEFNAPLFVALAKPYEGYLFPETYYFDLNVKPADVVEKMISVFDQNTQVFQREISDGGRTFKDIIIMASIIEEEARIADDKSLVSSILWKRLESGMPLQVDAPFYYIFGKASSMLTRTDLTNDSPYNTYTNKGLPPAPISNPGLVSIQASINATTTKYLFFLSDSEGNMHYAANHDGHLANKDKYIR